MTQLHRAVSWFAALAIAGCAPAAIGVDPQSVVVPGDWTPPESTRVIAARQHVDVVDPPTVLPLGSCTSTDPWVGTCTHPACIRAHPGTTALDQYIRGRWTYVGAGGTYTCRRNSNPASTQYLSVHSVGRAIDLMIPTIGGDADNTAGDAVANWLIENAEYIGIQRVIWDGRYWNGERGFSDISDAVRSDGSYVTDHHRNHIHVELSVDGAAQRTRFFTEGAPPTTCPIVCYGTAVVRADCSYTDCAVTGEVCLDGPPRCGAGAPPEPLEAALDGAAALPSVTPVAALSRFTFVGPTRLFDTRTPSESTRLARSDGATSGPLAGARSGTITDFPGAPAGATAVWMSVAAVPLTLPGFVSAVPAGTTSTTSSVNFAPPRVRANATVLPLGAGGGVTFFASTDVEVIADLFGTLGPTGLGLQAAGPLRVIDTRSTGMPLVGGTPLAVDVRAPAGAGGVVASVTVIGGAAPGFVVAYPCGAPVPSTSNLNFAPGSVSTTTVVSQLGGGQVCFVANTGAELIVDVTGYFVPDGELSYQALSPTRLLDTRSPGTRYEGRLGQRQVIELPIQTLPGMPADVHAVVVNLVTISPGTRGYLSAFPCGAAIPATASLNFDSDDATAALTVASVGNGSLCVFASARTHLVVDVLGAWVPTPAAPPPMDGPGPMDPDLPDDMDPPVMPGADAATLDDAGAAQDGAVVTADAGPRALSSGCGCGVARRGEPGALVSLLVLGLVTAARLRAVSGRRR